MSIIFVKDRQILDAVLVACDIVDYLKIKVKGNYFQTLQKGNWFDARILIDVGFCRLVVYLLSSFFFSAGLFVVIIYICSIYVNVLIKMCENI